MWKLIQLIFVGHYHIWETIDQNRLTQTNEYGGTASGQRFYLRCLKCGDVKKRDLI